MAQNDQDVTLDVGAAPDETGSGVSTPITDRADPAGAVMQLLAEGVPLTLLADLAAPDGPASQVILESEGLPDDAWWETASDIDAASDGVVDDLAVDPEAAHE